MSGIDDDELPFNIRPDLTPYLVHLTKKGNGNSALNNLIEILQTGVIKGTDSYVRGSRKAACFMDVPFAALKYVCSRQNSNRYAPYGVVIAKTFAYRRGTRPVLYLSDAEQHRLCITRKELWRVVKLQYSKAHSVWESNWLHEREWRCPDRFKLPDEIRAVLVRTAKEAAEVQAIISDDPESFTCLPQSIIPLNVICQGLNS